MTRVASPAASASSTRSPGRPARARPSVLIIWPPSRAFGPGGPLWLREAGGPGGRPPGRRSLGAGTPRAFAAFGPAPAARRQCMRLTEGVSLGTREQYRVDLAGESGRADRPDDMADDAAGPVHHERLRDPAGHRPAPPSNRRPRRPGT